MSHHDTNKTCKSFILEEKIMEIKGIAYRGYPKKVSKNTLIAYQAAIDLEF